MASLKIEKPVEKASTGSQPLGQEKKEVAAKPSKRAPKGAASKPAAPKKSEKVQLKKKASSSTK
ncbi:hypothetical protein Lal_00022296 [Lupinus albus]|uniref:Uncharacterized protein n=1 Tax=Lupinus albus TaxID=3870 RepID=A0A6A5N2K8_LUPAL|nr:hypothetical protein Lalb_Chr06g0170291 [Lupinus albus]KAF1880167.1 hypothetical protein Lal_00022296 [Lupinus albus]